MILFFNYFNDTNSIGFLTILYHAKIESDKQAPKNIPTQKLILPEIIIQHQLYKTFYI